MKNIIGLAGFVLLLVLVVVFWSTITKIPLLAVVLAFLLLVLVGLLWLTKEEKIPPQEPHGVREAMEEIEFLHNLLEFFHWLIEQLVEGGHEAGEKKEKGESPGIVERILAMITLVLIIWGFLNFVIWPKKDGGLNTTISSPTFKVGQEIRATSDLVRGYSSLDDAWLVKLGGQPKNSSAGGFAKAKLIVKESSKDDAFTRCCLDPKQETTCWWFRTEDLMVFR